MSAGVASADLRGAGIAIRDVADVAAAAREGVAVRIRDDDILLVLIQAADDLLQVRQGFLVEGQLLLLGDSLLQGGPPSR